jgi:ABC-2 type transport system ATP-binding protein
MNYYTNDVLKFFISQDIPIHSFNEVLPTLNEIFIQLVEGTPEARQFESIK